MACIRKTHLLVFAGLAFTGCVINNDDGDTEASTDGPTTNMTTAGTAMMTGDDDGVDDGAVTGTGTGMADDGGSTAGPVDDTAGSVDDTAGPTDDGMTTGKGGDAMEACLAACQHGAKCFGDDPAFCEDKACPADVAFAEKTGCVAEYVDQQNCAAALECADYEAWLDGIPEGDPDYPCEAEDAALFACDDPGGGMTTSASTG